MEDPRKTLSKKASQTAWRELFASWDLWGKACASEQCWIHRPLRGLPVQTLVLQTGKTEVRSTPAPAHSCSGGPASLFFTCGYISQGPCPAPWRSAAFKTPDSLNVLSPHSKWGTEQTNRTTSRVTQPVVLCGGLGPEHQTMSSKNKCSSLLHAGSICPLQQRLIVMCVANPPPRACE